MVIFKESEINLKAALVASQHIKIEDETTPSLSNDLYIQQGKSEQTNPEEYKDIVKDEKVQNTDTKEFATCALKDRLYCQIEENSFVLSSDKVDGYQQADDVLQILEKTQDDEDGEILEIKIEESGFTCCICRESFVSTLQIKAHMKTHMRPFVCEICGKAFSKKSYLSDHRETHSTEAKYECRFCFKKFLRRTVLCKHLRIHTHPKQIICEVCGRQFTDKATLNTHHLLVHEKVRKFKCLICTQTFPLKATLDKHILRHQRKDSDKCFSCSMCHMKYYDQSSLKRHVAVKHDNKRSCCEMCGKVYTDRNNLSKHLKRVHGTE